MRRLALVLSLILLLAAALSGCAKPASVPASHTFETSAFQGAWTPDWTFQAGGNTVLGMFNDNNPDYPSEAVLHLKNIPPDSSLAVSATLYLVGGWESSGRNADRFIVSAGGETLLTITDFPCRLRHGDEQQPLGANGTVETGKRILGYWVLPLSFKVPARAVHAGEVDITFRGELTGRGTEFWGLDDVQVAPGRQRGNAALERVQRAVEGKSDRVQGQQEKNPKKLALTPKVCYI
jgi:hypothetical protein